MEKSPKESIEHTTPPTVGIGKVVTVKLGGSERTFLVASADHGKKILPNEVSEDMIPKGMMIVSIDAPIGKALLGKPEGEAILPDEKAAEGYKKLGLEVMRVTSLEEFLASRSDDCDNDTNNKTDQ